jgi:excisionase family DNA binding protein
VTTDINSKMQTETYEDKRSHKAASQREPDLIGIEAAAGRLGISPWTLRRWIADRKLTSCKLGTRRLIPASEIDRLIRSGIEERDDTLAP